jgi:hypothetical protein
MADVVVLAKGTHQITVGKKNGAGSICPHQRRFLSKVGIITGNNGVICGFADPCFTLQPVHTTLSGTEHAGFQNMESALNLGV